MSFLMPNFLNAKKLLSVGLIMMFIGGFILTVSNSSTRVRGPGVRGVIPEGVQPPIYPKPGKMLPKIILIYI